MRIGLFISIFVCFLVLSYVYMGVQLAFAPWMWLALLVPYSGVFMYPVIVMLKRRGAANKTGSANPSLPQWLAYFSMAYLSFLGPLVIVRNIFILLFSALASHAAAGGLSAIALDGLDVLITPQCCLVLIIAAFFILLLGIWTAKAGPRVHSVKVPIAGLPAALEGFKIAQISDLHVGPTIREAYVKRVVDATNRLDANLVALTGDIGDGALSDFKKDAEPLRELKPANAIYYCVGNHEYYSDGANWLTFFKDLGFKVLLNAHQVVDFKDIRVLVAGVLDPAAGTINVSDKPNPELAIRGGEAAEFKLLLAHQPGIAERAEQAGFHLQLSGHTHGGQFFPWTLVVRKVHKYHQGLFTLRRMKIYVSPGTGSWGPPVRLGTRPEITLLTLTCENSQN